MEKSRAFAMEFCLTLRKTENKGLTYDTYLKERETLIDSEREGAKSFDKFILTLSAGAIGLSLTFITKIASDILPWSVWFLIIAWGTFVLSMLSTMVSLLTSQASCRKQRDILDELYRKQNSEVTQDNTFSILTNRLNIASEGERSAYASAILGKQARSFSDIPVIWI